MTIIVRRCRRLLGSILGDKSLRHRDVIKYVIFVAILLFCVVNVYRSSTFTSSHDVFRDEEEHHGSRSLHGDFERVLNISGWRRRPTRDPVEDYVERMKRIRVVSLKDYPEYNVTVNGVVRTVPLWQRRLQAERRTKGFVNKTVDKENSGIDVDQNDEENVYYFLAELLQVRIYTADKAKWSIKELKQWMHYLFLAGVEHIYLCDHFMYDHERLEAPLRKYIDLGLVTYFARGKVRDPMTAQILCYQHIINRFKRQHMWQIAIDMDEYPYSPTDRHENFLVRYLRNISEDITEISLPNYLMLGRGDRTGQTVIDRINRMTPRANELVKPIYRPQRVSAAVHHNHLLSGRHIDSAPDSLRMLHYWGGRGQQWGSKDTRKTLDITTVMDEMRQSWSKALANSLIVFGDEDAFGNTTGP